MEAKAADCPLQVIWVPWWDRLPHLTLDYVLASFQSKNGVDPGFPLEAAEAVLYDEDQIRRFWRLQRRRGREWRVPISWNTFYWYF